MYFNKITHSILPHLTLNSQKIPRWEGIIIHHSNHGLKPIATQKTTGNPGYILPHLTLYSQKIPRREGIGIQHFNHGFQPMAIHGLILSGSLIF
jgi:hypothetical protein